MLNKFRYYIKTGRVLSKLKKRGLIVGDNFDMMDGVSIDSSHCWHITIGDNVTLAPNVQIIAHDASTKKFFNYVKIGKVDIGNNVFVGMSSIIMPGVIIGDNVIIGSGSVVTKDVPSGWVVVGNPARKIMTTTEFLTKRKKEMSEYPIFEFEFTLNGNITTEKKKLMNVLMKDRFGHIV
jgi:maltose O-acetyltransferase